MKSSLSASTTDAGAANAGDRVWPMWLTTSDAREYLDLKSVASAYEWLRRHRVVRRSRDGKVCRLDLDRIRAKQRLHQKVHPRSLSNLRQYQELAS